MVEFRTENSVPLAKDSEPDLPDQQTVSSSADAVENGSPRGARASVRISVSSGRGFPGAHASRPSER